MEPADNLPTWIERRVDRFWLRDLARNRDATVHERIAQCGQAVAASVLLVQADDGGHVLGVQTCASVHACPVCAPKIRQNRAEELGLTIERWRDHGGRAFLVTLTAPHHGGEHLREVVGRLKASWGLMMEGDSHRELVNRIGNAGHEGNGHRRWLGIVRAIDFTWSERNGWHPHYHCVVFTPGNVSQNRVRRALVGSWQAATGTVGCRAVKAACDVQEIRDGKEDECALSVYAMKAGWEILRVDLKSGGAGFSPWEILRAGVEGGDVDGIRLWREYARTMHGEVAAYWSKGIRAWSRFRDRSDEERARGVLANKVELAEIHSGDWMALRRINGACAAVVQAVTLGTWRELLDALQVRWSEIAPRQLELDLPAPAPPGLLYDRPRRPRSHHAPQVHEDELSEPGVDEHHKDPHELQA